MKRVLALAVALAAAVSAPLASVEKWQDRAASELIGSRAVDRNGKLLGRISDLILSSQTGHVHYAVVRFDGWLSLGDKRYLYPASALAPGRTRGEVAIQIDRGDLGKRTGVAELETWLRQYDPNANIADRSFVAASELLGSRVEHGNGARAGELEDLVVNLGSGELRYAVLELEGRSVALPLHALTVPIVRGEPLGRLFLGG